MFLPKRLVVSNSIMVLAVATLAAFIANQLGGWFGSLMPDHPATAFFYYLVLMIPTLLWTGGMVQRYAEYRQRRWEEKYYSELNSFLNIIAEPLQERLDVLKLRDQFQDAVMVDMLKRIRSGTYTPADSTN